MASPLNKMTPTKNILIMKQDALQVRMHPLRKISLTAGILYLITFISIPTLSLYVAVHSRGYITENGPDTAAIIGGILEIIVALASMGSAIALYPVLKKQNGGLALGLVASRILEAGTIFVGVSFILTVVTMRQEGAGANALATSHALMILYDRIFLLGQSFMPAINDMLLGYLLFKSRLVPRGLALIGIIGGPILLIGHYSVQFNLIGQHASITGLFAIPVALFELSLGIYLIVKGFSFAGFKKMNVGKNMAF